MENMLPKLKRMLSFQPKTSKENGQEKKLSALFTPGFSCALDSLATTFPIDGMRDVYVSEMFLLKRKKDKVSDKHNGNGKEKGRGHYLVATLKLGKKTRGHWCITGFSSTGYEARAIERPFDSLSDRVVACFRFPAPSSSISPSPTVSGCPSDSTPPLTLAELITTAQTISTSQITPLLTAKNHELTTILLQLILERHNVPPSRQSFTLSGSSSSGLKALSTPNSPTSSTMLDSVPRRRNVLRKFIRSYYWQICIGLPRELGVERVPKRELGLLRGAVERAVRAHHKERGHRQQRGDKESQPQLRNAQSQPQLYKNRYDMEAMRYERVEVSFYDADATRIDRRREEEGDEATVCEGYDDWKTSHLEG